MKYDEIIRKIMDFGDAIRIYKGDAVIHELSNGISVSNVTATILTTITSVIYNNVYRMNIRKDLKEEFRILAEYNTMIITNQRDFTVKIEPTDIVIETEEVTDRYIVSMTIYMGAYFLKIMIDPKKVVEKIKKGAKKAVEVGKEVAPYVIKGAEIAAAVAPLVV